MDFAKRLKALRTVKKLKAAEVAMRAGVAPSSYQEWEQGRRILDLEVYFKLAQALEVTPGELMLGKSKSSEFQSLVEKIDHTMSELDKIKNTLLSSEF